MDILLLSHGKLAAGLLDSYNMIVGENDRVSAIGLTDEGIGLFRERLQQYMADKKDRVTLILTDIKGGTPFNEAYNLLLQHPEDIKVVTGMNLPMLIELGMKLEGQTSLSELYADVINVGKEAVSGIEELSQDTDDDIDF
ncbi:PTS sugar transporter subunit IIA [Vagococcus acidifermentans]|uniref:PTS sugar transporter subunit IIA n=1 Tax=Vagococcus acidifermentans TaxID=564710 RepID=UPI00147748D4|nr:PTS sugar transporter subunit IIA [Vagococcus acidifermentans]